MVTVLFRINTAALECVRPSGHGHTSILTKTGMSIIILLFTGARFRYRTWAVEPSN